MRPFKGWTVPALLVSTLCMGLMRPAGGQETPASREIRPGLGETVYDVRPQETLDLFVNTTFHAGHTPRKEWLVCAFSIKPWLYFITASESVAFQAGMSMETLAYPFAHAAATEYLLSVSPATLGLAPGDALAYAYLYAPEGEDTLIFDNVVLLRVVEPGALTTPGNPSELELFLKEGLRRNASLGPDRPYTPPFATDGGGGGGGQGGGGTAPAPEPAPNEFSTTNLQEIGVDEADRIKSDGVYLYVAPASGGTLLPIRVLRLASDPPGAAEVGRIGLRDHEKGVDGLYLVQGRGFGRPDLLVTVGGSAASPWYYWAEPWYWTGNVTEVVLYDVDRPVEARRLKHLKIDGSLVSSRRIGDTLYLVTRFTPSPPGFVGVYSTSGQSQINEDALRRATLPDLLPGFRVDGVSNAALVQPQDCYLPPFGGEWTPDPTLITVTAIRLSAPEQPVSRTVAGQSETLYASPQSLYLATLNDQTLTSPGALDRRSTSLHKFALEEDGPQYRASGSVPGHLGTETDKKPFRMGEYRGTLGVATSLGDDWSASSSTRLSLLQESEGVGGRSLREISFVGGLGKPGERLYATRFVGSRCYLVTFRVTDPLYVIDLSDPRAPRVLGELFIDGYSDYLHPVGETLLLGVGKDAIPDLQSSDFGGRGAWYQGVKLSLFEISDPARPRELTTVVIGKRGTQSAALSDHHAFIYLPPAENRPARLALPIQLNDLPPATSYYSYPWATYEWTHTGLYLFEIHTGAQVGKPAALEPIGAMIAASRAARPYPYDVSCWSDRGVLVDESVHYVHEDQVWCASWGNGRDMNGPH